jgi:hypothetical protein
MNSSYIGWKFVGFIKNYENIFLTFVLRFFFFKTLLEFIVDI